MRLQKTNRTSCWRALLFVLGFLLTVTKFQEIPFPYSGCFTLSCIKQSLGSMSM